MPWMMNDTEDEEASHTIQNGEEGKGIVIYYNNMMRFVWWCVYVCV
jgi:hypothetical protein